MAGPELMGDILAFLRPQRLDPLREALDKAIAQRTELYRALMAAQRAWRMADDAVHDLNRRIRDGEGPGAA